MLRIKMKEIVSSPRMVATPARMVMQVAIESVLHGVHWYMHEHDKDINDPSCPHCHAKEKNWKLDIYTGAIYDYTNGKLRIGKLSKSEMKKLWKTKGFCELVLKERLWYETTHHSDNPKRYPALPVIPFAQKRGKIKVCISNRWYASLQY